MIDETKIMQYADGTLPIEEHEEVKKAIEADPKLKELYNSFQETGDLLFKLGNEIKSKPLPQNLQDKADIIKTWKKPVTSEFGSFNFFGLFKIQYAGVAAACCLMFVGGMYADTFISGTSTPNSNQVTAMNQKIDAPKDLKFRGMPSAEEDLSTRVTNLYRYFDEEQFLEDINSKIDALELNE
jgi:anti-sigma factor RsiW